MPLSSRSTLDIADILARIEADMEEVSVFLRGPAGVTAPWIAAGPIDLPPGRPAGVARIEMPTTLVSAASVSI